MTIRGLNKILNSGKTNKYFLDDLVYYIDKDKKVVVGLISGVEQRKVGWFGKVNEYLYKIQGDGEYGYWYEEKDLFNSKQELIESL